MLLLFASLEIVGNVRFCCCNVVDVWQVWQCWTMLSSFINVQQPSAIFSNVVLCMFCHVCNFAVLLCNVVVLCRCPPFVHPFSPCQVMPELRVRRAGLAANDQGRQQQWWQVALGGLLVGFGSRLGSGCTSGHGVCGISRGSARSVVATLTFMVTGVITVFIMGMVL